MTVRADDLDPYVPERGNAGYQVTRYDLELDYAISSNRLDGIAVITALALDPLPRFALDLAGLRASKVTVDGQPARFAPRGAKLHVTPTYPIDTGDVFVVEVRYSGKPHPARSTWGPVGWEELADGVLVAAQPNGAPTWFPCNDLARQKAPFRIQVSAASSYRAVANGELLSERPHGNRTTWVYEQVEPTSPYLMTLHVGRYERRRVTRAPIPVHLIAPAPLRHDVDRAFARQTDMLRLFVDRFGPYPFAAGYTVVISADPLEVPLEAQGQSIFGSNHLDGSTERLIAHELAHQWFGNSVTAASWRDVWLHEGFACYAEWIWSEASGGPGADELAHEHHHRLRSLPQDLLLGDPGAEDMFDDRVYKRGALTLHVLRGQLGDDRFFELLRTWVATHRHGTGTTDSFLALAEQVGGRPVDDLLGPWLRHKRIPALSSGRG